jgi:hypothetical protein
MVTTIVLLVSLLLMSSTEDVWPLVSAAVACVLFNLRA